MKIRSTLGFIIIVLLILRWFACRPAPDKGGIAHLTNRVWVDRVAKNPRDMVFRLVLLKPRKVGVAMAGSRFRFAGDALRFQVKGKDLKLTILQDKAHASFKARTWACTDAPAPFDLCLELKRGDRRIVLYSEKKSKVRGDESWMASLPDAATAADAECDGCADAAPRWFDRLTADSAD